MATPIALLSEVVAAQIRTNEDAARVFEIVVAERSLEPFLAQVKDRAPPVLLIELDRLGDTPVQTVASLAKTPNRIVIVTFSFAKRGLLEELTRAGATVMKQPVQLQALRLQTLSVFVGGVLAKNGNKESQV